ncbi:hypothetical protein ACH40F_58385 [Streptomyces sp. NPDC020794]|uniref:hypothetical protein n=1 Tax=unclassified Streptomyces TaxID=2593676 RepID=UPI0036E297C8
MTAGAADGVTRVEGTGHRTVGASGHHNNLGDGPTYNYYFPTPARGEASRQETLSELALASRGRLIERWAAVGLSDDLAAGLADDPAIGRGPAALPRLPEVGLVLLEGAFGSGKSVTAERLHQDDIAAAQRNTDAPVPVYLTAQAVGGHLVDAVSAAAEQVGDCRWLGVRLVLDGLDDLAVTRAAELIDQARALARNWPNSRAVATARPGLPDLRGSERLPYPPMSTEEALALAQRISDRPRAVPMDSEAVREALRLPLFIIIAALASDEGRQVPTSRIDFLENLVARALRRSGADRDGTRAALASLARLTIEAGGPVAAGEVGDDTRIRTLVASRLVVHRGRTIAFGLPVLEQYFGGKAALEQGLPEEVLESPAALERWRYPLALAIAAAGWERSLSLLEPILARHPGVVPWLLHEGIPSDGRGSSVPLPPVIRCAERIHRTLAGLLPALAPAAELLKIGGADAAPPLVLAVHYDNDFEELLTVARHTPLDDGGTGPVRLPEPLDWESVKAFKGQGGTQNSGRPAADYPAWPWRWSLDWITHQLTPLLQQKALHAHLPGPAARERQWSLCRAISGRNSVLSEPISADEVLTILRRNPHLETLRAWRFSSGLRASGTELRRLVSALEAGDAVQADGAVHCPYPPPNLPSAHTRWVLGLFSDDRLAKLTSHIHTNALVIYQDLCEAWFPALIPTLGLACIQPLQITGHITRDDHDDPTGFIAYEYSFDMIPLPVGEPSTATFTYRGPRPFVNDWDAVMHRRTEIRRAVHRLHPDSEPWAHPRTEWGALNKPSDTPATDLAYRWLWEDLQALRMVSGPPPR